VHIFSSAALAAARRLAISSEESFSLAAEEEEDSAELSRLPVACFPSSAADLLSPSPCLPNFAHLGWFGLILQMPLPIS
jgi:hypothetical protein